MNVALVTCSAMPDPDEDQERLCSALEKAGARARWIAWDDPGTEWGTDGGTDPTKGPVAADDMAAYDIVVLRSTWNYHLHLPAFQAWVERVAEVTQLWNPPDVIATNAHKGYLLELEQQGVPIVPTALVRRGPAPSLEALCASRGWDAIVVKPAVSGGSFATRRFSSATTAEAQAFFVELTAQRDVLVQPLLASFVDPGERCLVWIDGAFTHAIHKEPRYSGDAESVHLVEPRPDELALAERLVEPYAERLLYARVDLVLDRVDGLQEDRPESPGADDAPARRPLLCELELIEPSLFLRHSQSALERLVAGILRRARDHAS